MDARTSERLFCDAEDAVVWLWWEAWPLRLLERGAERYSKMRASDIVALLLWWWWWFGCVVDVVAAVCLCVWRAFVLVLSSGGYSSER